MQHGYLTVKPIFKAITKLKLFRHPVCIVFILGEVPKFLEWVSLLLSIHTLYSACFLYVGYYYNEQINNLFFFFGKLFLYTN